MVKFEPLKIAMDYDETFNADKQMWATIIKFMIANGCDVRFVTFRHEHPATFSNEDILQDSDKLNIPIIFCEGVQKRAVTERKGFNPDIWIDDSPEFIPNEVELSNQLLHIHKKERNPVVPNSQITTTTVTSSVSSYPEETLVIPR